MTTMRWNFKEENDLEARISESGKIKTKYPDRIPVRHIFGGFPYRGVNVIVQKAAKSNVPSIDKHKFLVPSDISVAQLMWIIRKRIQLAPEKAIFLFVGKVLPQSSASISAIYKEYADEDGFLYIMYSGESTFGSSCAKSQ